MIDRPRIGSPGDESDGPNPYLQPVPTAWARAAGIVLLTAMVGLTVVLGYGLLARFLHGESRTPITSSELIFLLMLVVVWGFCAQAGWRLLVRRAGEPGALFSWPVWLALAAVLFTLTGIVATLRLAAGVPMELTVQVILFGGGLGGWCLWLAWKSRQG